jgi:putative AdoMet-dependent methyltransferase
MRKGEGIKEGMMDYYDERAGEYDEVYTGGGPAYLRPQSYKRDTEEIKGFISNFGKDYLIDIGCGTGFWLPSYERNCSRITLIDQSEKMLVQCRGRIGKLGVRRKCHLLRGDFFSYNFRGGFFDSALAGFFLSHLRCEKECEFFKRLRSILKPGSRLMVIDTIWNKERQQFQEKEGFHERTLNDGRSFVVYKRYFLKSDVERIFKEYSVILESAYWGEVFFAVIGKI